MLHIMVAHGPLRTQWSSVATLPRHSTLSGSCNSRQLLIVCNGILLCVCERGVKCHDGNIALHFIATALKVWPLSSYLNFEPAWSSDETVTSSSSVQTAELLSSSDFCAYSLLTLSIGETVMWWLYSWLISVTWTNLDDYSRYTLDTVWHLLLFHFLCHGICRSSSPLQALYIRATYLNDVISTPSGVE